MPNYTKEMFDPKTLTQADVKAFVTRYKNEPVLFCEEILLIEPDENQVAILNSVKNNDLTAVTSGRGTGKSVILGAMSIWILSTRPNAKVLLAANTDAQSRSVLWPPMITLLRKSLISDWFDNSTELVYFKGDSESAFIKRLSWSENNIESVSGYHSRNMIYMLDEASKMPNALIENLYASLTEDWNKMIMCSNPTRNAGYFYDACQAGSGWNVIEIDSRKSKWTNKDKVFELISKYGEDSDIVRVQVLGKFPRLSSTTIISDELIKLAMYTTNPQQLASDITVIGMDVGGGGDPTVWAVRRGLKLLEVIKSYDTEQHQLVSQTTKIVNKYKANKLIIDKTGLGFHLPGVMTSALPNVDVIGRNFGESSLDQKCENMRAYMYLRLADWFAMHPHIGQNHELREELLAIEYTMSQKGKYKLIPKEQIKDAIGRSCDIADALALSCCYNGDLIGLGGGDRMGDDDVYQMTKMIMDASKWC